MVSRGIAARVLRCEQGMLAEEPAAGVCPAHNTTLLWPHVRSER